VNASFGARVRHHRHQARLSLEALAARSGVSRATLSKIERGERNPSLTVAARVADAVGAPLAELLGHHDTPAVRVVRGDSEARLVDRTSGAVRESVLPAIDGVEVVRYTLLPNSSAGPFHPHPAGAREVFIVLEGVLQVQSGIHRVELEAGDVAAVPGDLSHSLTNPGDSATRVMLILIPHTQI
jgi:transcriptional regulator with XRE-family HTH domain